MYPDPAEPTNPVGEARVPKPLHHAQSQVTRINADRHHPRLTRQTRDNRVTLRVCAEPDCPELIKAGTRDGRCTTHRRAKNRARGSSTQRGYGTQHQKLRAHWQRRLDNGEPIQCWRCGQPINPDAWDLGHTDSRTGYAGPECRPCNRATAPRKGRG